MNILVIIPARGGSRGIPRKNLRTLNDRPLIYYSINTALNSKFKPDVVVSSDDDEILMFARRFGAETFKRPKTLADDKTTLEPVIYNAFAEIAKRKKKNYEIVITIQPTSPMLSTSTLDKAIAKFIGKSDVDVLISVKEKRHLSWKIENNRFVPNYSERLNRQQLEPVFEETGSFVICRADNLVKSGKRITGKVDLYELSKKEAIDIDDYDDWALCEFYLKRKKILFVLTGNHQNGLGHIYRSIVLAYGILNHEIAFLVDNESKLGYDKLNGYYFTTYIQEHENILDDIRQINPDVVINDRLDTSEAYMKSLKSFVPKVINFEDNGSGTIYADLVINALYPEKKPLRNHYFGYEYFCARDEFINTKVKEVEDVNNVLVSFGGVDPNNLTRKVVESIYEFCKRNRISITVVEGLGYKEHKSLNDFPDVKIIRNVTNISEYFLESDIIFTSAGRTVYEIACIGTPSIVIPQNEREMTHLFADSSTGFIKLGLGKDLENQEILTTFAELTENKKLRKEMNKKMLSYDLRSGKKRTLSLMNQIIEDR
ncbi:MAG: acylneuraminate cytidylyltransferase [Bacteroidetes bacterium 4484_276]|nr:MAG: acylneuraminate cytidylyltransferase [Bacteroidetes bacterium 4484_276]